MNPERWARLAMTGAPFALALLVWLLLRWI